MALVLFDLDNTLLGGDSDHEWGNFLVKKGLVDGPSYTAANDAFYEKYKAGCLDIVEYSAFSFTPLSQHSMAELQVLHAEFMESVIRPMVGKKAKLLVEKHRRKGDILVIITATNSFVTKPIAELFGIDNLIATEVQVENGRFVNKIDGIPCYQEGKVERLQDWLLSNRLTLENSVFYSDSINDLPLLETVASPVAVDPDHKLKEIANQRGWKIMSLL